MKLKNPPLPDQAHEQGTLTRRAFVTGSVAASFGLLAACSARPKVPLSDSSAPSPYELMYGPLPNERFPLPAVDLKKLDKKFVRQEVRYRTDEKVGTLVVDTRDYFLYLVQENGLAMRYGVGLGRAGFEWSGRAIVARKAIWPKWTPPTEMIGRQPELEQWSAANGGMPPGPDNPLGARALYIFQDGRDTLYRVHGTAEVWSIGKAVSSGCVRLLNHDIIDLHRRVPNQTPIIVI